MKARNYEKVEKVMTVCIYTWLILFCVGGCFLPWFVVFDIAIFVLKRDVKLQLTNFALVCLCWELIKMLFTNFRENFSEG